MKKELTPTHEMVACDVCGRTILKGERTEPYVVPDGSRRLVCELCTRRAEGAGWRRESTHSAIHPAAPRAEPRRSLLGRLRRRLSENGPEAAGESELPPDAATVYQGPARWRPEEEEAVDRPPPQATLREPSPEPPQERDVALELDHERSPVEEPSGEPPRSRRERWSRRHLGDPRHVRAVPTNAEAKVERALELFNGSEFSRTVGGLARTLGPPWVTALPQAESPSEVTVVVAWELSWYQYRVDLGDALEPVALVRKGREIAELEESLRRWNATAGTDGMLEPGTPGP